jgi:deoxyribonuclease-4
MKLKKRSHESEENKMIILGSHVSLGGKDQYLGSVKEALSYGATALMVYTGAPQNTIRLPLARLRIPEAQALLAESGIPRAHVIVHAPYIVNLANPSVEKRQFAIDFLTAEVRRTAAMGITTIVIHPGAHMNGGPEIGARLIAEGIRGILINTEGLDVVIALEGMAGKGTEVGRSFEEIKMMLDLIGVSDRVGVCFDTCHTHDAGYDLINDFEGVLAQFDRVIGLSRIRVIHLNDSKNPQGAHKDRHANIGFGYIGFNVLNMICRHDAFRNIPKILETPYVPDFGNDKIAYPPYKYEISMLREGIFNPAVMDLIRQSTPAESVGE